MLFGSPIEVWNLTNHIKKNGTKNIQLLVFSFLPIDPTIWWFKKNVWFATFETLICKPKIIWGNVFVLEFTLLHFLACARETTKVLCMCFDRILLAFESHDLSQADKSIKRVFSVHNWLRSSKSSFSVSQAWTFWKLKFVNPLRFTSH